MASTTTSGGVTWAVPVRPDKLGEHLQAYKTTLPTLTTLRLCHRFGKGPNVHVTKLPVEIEQTIEDIIFTKALSYYPFGDAFEHFESRCMPIDHLEDGYCDIFSEARDEVLDGPCEKCEALNEDDEEFNDECCDDCMVEVHIAMNERMCEVGMDWKYECCESECQRWIDLISKEANGKFAPYNKMLLEYFGLEAYFATTRVNKTSKALWPEDINHIYHAEDELKTTICYLTLPKPMGYNAEYESSEMEDMIPYVNIQSSESCIIELPTLEDKEKRSAQFKRALRTLKLKPYVHPSQLTSTLSSTSPSKKLSQAEAGKNDEKGAHDKAKGVADVEWPQLIMLSKTSFQGD